MVINEYLYTHNDFTTDDFTSKDFIIDYRSTLKDTINRESSRKPYERLKKSNNYLPDYYRCYDDPIDNEKLKKYCEVEEQRNIKKYLPDYCKDNTAVSSLLNEDYNNNYIEVSLIFSCPMHYIIKTIDDYYGQLCDLENSRGDYNICYFYYKKEGNLIKIINMKETLIYNLSKLDNNCISFDNYEKLKVYLRKKYILPNNIFPYVEEIYTFVLNEIEKYLA